MAKKTTNSYNSGTQKKTSQGMGEKEQNMETKVENQMTQQNQKNIRKNKEGKMDKKNIKNSFVDKTKKNEIKESTKKREVTNKNVITPPKLSDIHVITEKNQKVKVLNDVSTVDGTLHKDEVVTVESTISTGYKVIDNVGRFWFVKTNDISTKL